MAERFHVNFSLAPGPVELAGPEAHHLSRVCRIRPGDAVCLFNGDGHQYSAEVVEVGRNEVTLKVIAVEAPEREIGFRLEVAAPLPKGDRATFLLEKLTELGVTAFTPLTTNRSVVHPRETKLERLQRQVIEASKQCGRNVLMEVRDLQSWEDFLQFETPDRKWLAHPRVGGMKIGEEHGLDVVLAVGPEGGFTDKEVDAALEAGWKCLDLGRRILRVETAAIAGAVLLAR